MFSFRLSAGNVLAVRESRVQGSCIKGRIQSEGVREMDTEGNNPYPTAFPYGNGMVLHFYQQLESSTTKTVHKVINKGLKAYV